jgi:hypothetical protein
MTLLPCAKTLEIFSTLRQPQIIMHPMQDMPPISNNSEHPPVLPFRFVVEMPGQPPTQVSGKFSADPWTIRARHHNAVEQNPPYITKLFDF